jgi:hypothetical protein
MATALVHIGTHKTGTTSFQKWTDDHRQGLLDRNGIHVYRGQHLPANAPELAVLCLRANRMSPAKEILVESSLQEWRDETARHVAEQVASDAEHLLVSAEDLSLLRHDDEVERLRELLAPRDLRVAVCLRDPASFLASYRLQLKRMGQPPSRFPSSHRNFGPDSWLVQWDEMLDVWRRVLGADRVVSFDYADALTEHRSTIPAVLEALGIDASELPSWDRYRENVTSERQTARAARVQHAKVAFARTRTGTAVRRVLRRTT